MNHQSLPVIVQPITNALNCTGLTGLCPAETHRADHPATKEMSLVWRSWFCVRPCCPIRISLAGGPEPALLLMMSEHKLGVAMTE